MRLNFNKIICINLESLNSQQLFAVAEHYRFGFEGLYECKNKTKIQKYWLLEGGIVVAFQISNQFIVATEFNPLTKSDYDQLKSMKPVKTPKTPNDDVTLNNYRAFLEEGFEDIRTSKMDARLEWKKSNQNKVQFVDLPVVLEVDAILDKIAKYGIGSITKEEKEFLDNSVN